MIQWRLFITIFLISIIIENTQGESSANEIENNPENDKLNMNLWLKALNYELAKKYKKLKQVKILKVNDNRSFLTENQKKVIDSAIDSYFVNGLKRLYAITARSRLG